MKKIAFSLFVCLLSVSVRAQDTQIKGRVLDAHTQQPLAGTTVGLEEHFLSTTTDAAGDFSLSGLELPLGEQVVILEKNGYLPQRLPVTVQQGAVIDLSPVLLQPDIADFKTEIGTIILADDELDGDESGADNISGLLQASRDVVLSAAAFDFSAAFFRPRGLDTEYGKVYINGLEMNKLFNGRPQWANWGGLNDMQRNQEFVMGMGYNDMNYGSPAGSTNMTMRASENREGGRISYALANRSYTGRVMASYNSGLLKSGWAYSFLVSRRFGQEGYVDGTLYDANGFFAAVEKKLNDKHALNFTAFYSPNRRGRASATTQEVYDIKGTRYNAFWGEQDGEIRNSRIRETEEPVFILSHNWQLTDKTELSTNVGYQFGKIGNSRIGQDNARHPDPTYYQYMPSYALANPNGPDYAGAYHNLIQLQNDGQIDWQRLYETNIAYGGTSRYYLYEDRNDDKLWMANTVLTTELNDNIRLNGGLNFRSLKSENFANMLDLLGGNGYLDIDVFSEGDQAQNDLQNPNRIVREGDRFRYNFSYEALTYNGFAQAKFQYKKVDFYLGAQVSQTQYQRIGHYQNGNHPGNSLGGSEELSFSDYSFKGGLTYKVSGRHLIDMNASYLTNAPYLRNSFSNARQNNNVSVGLESEKIQTVDLSYIYRSPRVKGRVTGFYTGMQDGSNIAFYYADGISGVDRNNTNFFVQEVMTGVDKGYMGVEMGVEAQVTPTIKLKGVAAIGDYRYTNNPNVYLTSDDFEEVLDFGKTHLENYRLSVGPQQAYQLGFEYRDPNFWWVGATANFLAANYINPSPLLRTNNFYTDVDGAPFNDYDEELARELLRQERFEDVMLVNIVGGKSWRIPGNKYVGFFATVNNVFGEVFKTGGFEQARNANYRALRDDRARNTPVFGPRYWYGYGTTYYMNVYLRF